MRPLFKHHHPEDDYEPQARERRIPKHPVTGRRVFTIREMLNNRKSGRKR